MDHTEINEIVDNYHVESILDEICQEDLKGNVVHVRRLAKKGKTRPLHVNAYMTRQRKRNGTDIISWSFYA